MPKANNPYSRPVNATKESAKTIGEYYGTLTKSVAVNHAAGGRQASPAARYQVAGNAYKRPTVEQPKPKPKAKAKPAITNVISTDAAVTAEDLFG